MKIAEVYAGKARILDTSRSGVVTNPEEVLDLITWRGADVSDLRGLTKSFFCFHFAMRNINWRRRRLLLSYQKDGYGFGVEPASRG